MIRSEEITPGQYNIFFCSTPDKTGHVIGEAIRDVDGYFYFYCPNMGNGTWPSYALRAIANELDRLNKDWDDHLTEYFKNEQTSTQGNREE